MTVLVTDAGIAQDDWRYGYIPLAAVARRPDLAIPLGIDLPDPALDAKERARLRALLPHAGLIRIALRQFGDTAALALARDLRLAGFHARLRAHGAVAARFYTMLRRSGFSEIELDARQARLQPEEHWCNAPDWLPAEQRPAAPTV